MSSSGKQQERKSFTQQEQLEHESTLGNPQPPEQISGHECVELCKCGQVCGRCDVHAEHECQKCNYYRVPAQPPEVPQREPMTIHNAIGLSKSIHGMCVDELPHEEIRRTVIVLAGMLHYLASLAQREEALPISQSNVSISSGYARELAEREDDYVAWCRFTGNNGPIVTCDSDAPGAFRVYRHPAQAQREEAPKPRDAERVAENIELGRIEERTQMECKHAHANLVVPFDGEPFCSVCARERELREKLEGSLRLTEQFLVEAFGPLDNLPMTVDEFLAELRALLAQQREDRP